MRGSLLEITRRLTGAYVISFVVDGDPRPELDGLDSDLDITVAKHRKRRSLDANAYFHVLASKIDEKTGDGITATKKRLVQEYGTLARDDVGNIVGVKLPVSVDVDKLIEYTRFYDKREEGGRLFNLYLVLKPTHEMQSDEMARLIEGTISEAKELGIETLPPKELEALIGRINHTGKKGVFYNGQYHVPR